jgi:hypothetical protein
MENRIIMCISCFNSEDRGYANFTLGDTFLWLENKGVNYLVVLKKKIKIGKTKLKKEKEKPRGSFEVFVFFF